MIGENNTEKRVAAKKAAKEYYDKKKKKPSSAVMGFIEKNGIVGKTTKEIDTLISQATKLGDGTLFGEGDKFKRWCELRGRDVPSDEIVEEMNRDPFNAGQIIKKDVPNNPKVWRSWCTYRAGGGRIRV